MIGPNRSPITRKAGEHSRDMGRHASHGKPEESIKYTDIVTLGGRRRYLVELAQRWRKGEDFLILKGCGLTKVSKSLKIN